MSGFLDKAKEMAEDVKDKIEDIIPDSVEEKLGAIKDKIEDKIPGDKDGDGH
jgi:uncharacterized protein YjbJ (UPF0337 family)